MREGGPPCRPFSAPTAAREWYEATRREHQSNHGADAELASIEELRSRVRAAWERDGDKGMAVVLAEHFGKQGAPRRIETDFSQKPPPREWLVPEWLTAHRVSLLVGSGGAGKSRVALQLTAAVAAGTTWIEGATNLQPTPSTPRVAVFATWEDEIDELGRRLHGYADGVPELEGRFKALDFAGCGPLWGPGAHEHLGTVGTWTHAGRWLMEYCEAKGARLLVVDPLAAAFGSDENSRAVVRQFMSSLDAWARAAQCTVLIIAHPPKARGEPYSGNTDWHASGRTMLELGLHETNSGKAPCLRRHKGNYVSSAALRLWLAGYPQWYSTDKHEAARRWGKTMKGVGDTDKFR